MPLFTGVRGRVILRQFAKITHLGYALQPYSIIQSVHCQAGRPSSPSEERRPGFSVARVPVPCRCISYVGNPELVLVTYIRNR